MSRDTATTEVEVPAVPFLRRGAGKTPVEGGCIMQVISWIHDGSWTDEPPCVHPVIRHLAIRVNDRLDDADRQALIDLGPRMSGTAGGDEALTRKLLGFLARQVYPIYAEWAEEADYDDGGAVLACIEAAEGGHVEAARVEVAARAATWAAGDAETWAVWAAGAAGTANVARVAEAAVAAGPNEISLLTALLDHYDEITGRTDYPTLDYASVCDVMARA